MKKLLSNIIYFFIFHLRIWKLFLSRYFGRHGSPVLAVFNYHRVIAEHRDSFIMEYEFGLLARDFEKQMLWLKKNFKIIKVSDLSPSLLKKNSRKPLALITFDDADSEFYDIAYPILKKHDLTAIMFVPTNFIESGKAFFHLRFTNLCNQLKNHDWGNILQTELPSDIKDKLLKYKADFESNSRELRHDIGLSFFRMNREQVEALLDKWESIGDIRYDLGIKCMSWDQIIEVHRQGIEIGSHSANHFQLARMDEQAIKSEVTESRAELEKRLGVKIETISYPVGSYDDRVLEQTRLAGYKYGFTTREEIVTPDYLTDRPREIPRISIGYAQVYRIMHPFIKSLVINCSRQLSKTSNIDANKSQTESDKKKHIGNQG